MGRSVGFAAVVFALALLGSHPPAFAADPSASSAEDMEARRALASEVVDLGLPEEIREELFFRTMDLMTVQMRQAAMQGFEASDEEVIAILDRWLADWVEQGKSTLRGHIPAIMDGWKAAYSEMYSVKELSEIRAFVATPTGSKFFARMQEVMSNPHFADANQAYINEIMAKLPAARQELVSQIKAYLETKAQSPEH